MLSSSPQDLHLDQIASSECSLHENSGGLAPFFKCGTLQAAIHIHVLGCHESVSVSQRIQPHVSGKKADSGWRSSSRAFNPLLGFELFVAGLHVVPFNPMHLLQRGLGDRTCLIGMWQPKLNHPYIVSFLKRGALGFRPNRQVRISAFSRFGLRLLRKLRKRLHTQLQPEIFQLKRRSAREILFNLTCFSRAPFEEIKRLRSDRYAPDEIYSLIRLSNSLEEPGKTRARQALQSVRKHRNMSWPRSALGLQLKFTADPSFGSEISRWIRRQVLCHKHILIPFHQFQGLGRMAAA